MKCSIVITNYNQSTFLETSIKSAFSQDFPKDEYEIVIVDDGSTDNSVQKVDDYISSIDTAGVSFKLLIKDNGGTASARNLGVQQSIGEYICFLDADDEYGTEKLSRSISEIEIYPRVGVVYSDYIEMDESGGKRVTFKAPFDAAVLMSHCMVSTNSMVSREAFDKVGGFDTSIKACEDYDFWLRVSNAGFMIRHIPEVLFTYRCHSGQKTQTYNMEEWAKEEGFIKERARHGGSFVQN